MAEVPQETADRLALRAKRGSDRGEYQDAIEQQRRAIEVRERELAELDPDSPTLADERKAAAHRLSDYWGRLGGIYRRAGQISDGIDAYRHGMEIEREFRIDDSYNLTNWIVLPLLEDPARLAALAGQINDAIAIVQVQVDGPRRDQWWAWADFGLLCLLGRRPQEARTAYDHFRQTGPTRADYGSVLAVLRSLQEQFERPEPELAADLSDAIKYLESARGEL
jgi:tetratricopeptide (TPR) repeat protein